MRKEYIVKITEQAQEHLRQIVDYITHNLLSPTVAINLFNTLEEEIASLSQFPNRFALTEEEPWRSSGIHKMPVKNFLIYFLVDEIAHKVQVTAIIYGRRSQKHQLMQMSIETEESP